MTLTEIKYLLRNETLCRQAVADTSSRPILRDRDCASNGFCGAEPNTWARTTISRMLLGEGQQLGCGLSGVGDIHTAADAQACREWFLISRSWRSAGGVVRLRAETPGATAAGRPARNATMILRVCHAALENSNVRPALSGRNEPVAESR
jgi:hypothetical protein